MSRPSARERLLDAAVAVVRRDGAQALTLDAVAAEAGVSKGGLLYHFRSKRDLLDALVERPPGRTRPSSKRRCSKRNEPPRGPRSTANALKQYRPDGTV